MVNPVFIPLGGKPRFYPAWRQTQLLSRLAANPAFIPLCALPCLRTQVLSRLAPCPACKSRLYPACRSALPANPGFIPLGAPLCLRTQVLSRLAAFFHKKTAWLSRLVLSTAVSTRWFRSGEMLEVVGRANHAAVFSFFIGHRTVLDCAGKLFGARTGECADVWADLVLRAEVNIRIDAAFGVIGEQTAARCFLCAANCQTKCNALSKCTS